MRESHLLFLVDAGSTLQTPNTRLWITSKSNGKPFFGNFDAMAFPESSQSMFCVVDGQDAKARPMLERVASELVASTEALAVEERAVIDAQGHGLRIYASVIVTTAELLLSTFDTATVELDSGTVSIATHQIQRWVRFRKHLSPTRQVTAVRAGDTFESRSTAKERLVFVVNAMHLAEFLNEWRVLDHSLRPLM